MSEDGRWYIDSSSSSSCAGSPFERAIPAIPESGDGGCGAFDELGSRNCDGCASLGCGEGFTEGTFASGAGAGSAGSGAFASSLGGGVGSLSGSTTFAG